MTALDDDEFARLMAELGPFEKAPHLAVAVSGGADSVALCLLAERWARAQGGQVTALTVDHGLRVELADEAALVHSRLAARLIAHEILRWEGPKPQADIQAAAREARYRLMLDWCGRTKTRHLLLGHHLDDQAETFLLRLARGSGVDGLAAMASVSARGEVRLLRPLLSTPQSRLRATLLRFGEAWIEDPSNKSDLYRRSRLRKLMPALQDEGLTAERLAATAKNMARARQALETVTDDLVVKAVSLADEGFGWLDSAVLTQAPREIALRLLARLCRCVGGGEFPPRLARLERLLDELAAGLSGRRTFGGCLLVPKGSTILVQREVAVMASPVSACGEGVFRWDDRFTVTMQGGWRGDIGPLGQQGWQSFARSWSRRSFPRLYCRACHVCAMILESLKFPT